MRKILAVLMVLLASNVYAADKVVVVPLGGDTTNIILDPSTIVSAYGRIESSNVKANVYTVPVGKTFVLTDIICSGPTPNFLRITVNVTQTVVDLPCTSPFAFSSGIPIVSGSVIGYYGANNAAGTISGYLY